MAAVNYVISPFEGNINFVNPTGIKLYLWETKEIEKETYKLDISVSNDEDIIYHFLCIANKYGWGILVSVVNTGTGANNIFKVI